MASKENQEALNSLWEIFKYKFKTKEIDKAKELIECKEILQKAIDRLEFVEKQFDIIDIVLTDYIAKNLGITKNEDGIYGYDNYAKILNVRKELVKLAKEELKNE